MSHNDSLCEVSSPQMTQNDSLCKASMTQMTQNDSHFEVSSFGMTQNDSFSGLKCPTEHPLSVADEPPATPPSPQNDTPSNTRPAPMADPASSIPEKAETGAKPPTRRRLSRGSGKRDGVAMAVNGKSPGQIVVRPPETECWTDFSPLESRQSSRRYEDI